MFKGKVQRPSRDIHNSDCGRANEMGDGWGRKEKGPLDKGFLPGPKGCLMTPNTFLACAVSP